MDSSTVLSSWSTFAYCLGRNLFRKVSLGWDLYCSSLAQVAQAEDANSITSANVGSPGTGAPELLPWSPESGREEQASPQTSAMCRYVIGLDGVEEEK